MTFQQLWLLNFKDGPRNFPTSEISGLKPEWMPFSFIFTTIEKRPLMCQGSRIRLWTVTRFFSTCQESQWTHLRRFAIDSTSKFHVKSSWKLHRFLNANRRGNYDIDSTRKFRRGFHFQNWRNINKFSKWIFLCRFNVQSTLFLYTLFPLYHFLQFLLWELMLSYSGIVQSRCSFNNIDVITDIEPIETIGNISFGNFCNNTNKEE